MARPTKLSADLTEEIVGHIRNGNNPEDSAIAAGIAGSTFYFWMAQGRDGIVPFLEFSDAIRRAQAEAVSRRVAHITRAALGGTWRTSAWWLEKHAPELYGKNNRKRLEQERSLSAESRSISFEELEAKVAQILEARKIR